jgi:hypothetical protein
MNGIFTPVVVAVVTSIFTVIILFSNFSISPNAYTQTTMVQIPAMLQENDNSDGQNNLKLTDHVYIDPLDAILTATKDVSAQPSDLRSFALETKNGHPVFSMDIFGSNSNRSVEVTVDAVKGKALTIVQDLDDGTDNAQQQRYTGFIPVFDW